MSRLDMSVELPGAPRCAPWCTGHDSTMLGRGGWEDLNPAAGVAKTCVRHLGVGEATGDLADLDVSIERYASLRWRGDDDEGHELCREGISVELDSPTIRIGGIFTLTPEESERLAGWLRAAATLARQM